MPQEPKEITKQNYKLGIAAKQDIITMLKSETKQAEIVATIKTKYDIDITPSRLSQIKGRLVLFEFGTYSKRASERIRNREHVDEVITKIIDKSYDLLEKWLEGLSAGDLTTKDAMIIGMIATNAHKIYNDMHRVKDNNESASSAIRRELGLDEHAPQTPATIIE